MSWRFGTTAGTVGNRWPGPQEEKLDRALVAGLMLEAILEAPGLPAEPQARRHLIKTSLRETLVSSLAGRVTLDRFRALVHKLDHWFALYYPLLFPAAPAPPETSDPGRVAHLEPRAAPLAYRAVREDLLAKGLQDLQGLLPRRRHCKVTGERLGEFLRRTQGGWFRLQDFARYFVIDRKTAWEYLQKLWQAGLLIHNQGRSAAVRYSLSPRFLTVRADILRQRVAATLPDLPPALLARAGDALIATGGEAFWEEELSSHLGAARHLEILTRLKAAALLEVPYQCGGSQMLRLPQRWLQQ